MPKRKRVEKKRRGIRIQASARSEKKVQGIRADLGLYRPRKKPVTLRLDADVLEWFKKQGRGYQTRINQVLREWVIRAEKGRG